MLINNEVLSDGRVMRSAKALAKKYDVEVIGWLRPERKDSFKHNRLESLPFKLHLMELGWSSKLPKNMFGYFKKDNSRKVYLLWSSFCLRNSIFSLRENIFSFNKNVKI